MQSREATGRAFSGEPDRAIASAYVSNNTISTADVGRLIAEVARQLRAVGEDSRLSARQAGAGGVGPPFRWPRSSGLPRLRQEAADA